MQVLLLSPMKESLSTWVSLLARNGKWAPRLPNALMHSFKASKLLLISAPSILVCRSELEVSAPLSFPADRQQQHTGSVIHLCPLFYRQDSPVGGEGGKVHHRRVGQSTKGGLLGEGGPIAGRLQGNFGYNGALTCQIYERKFAVNLLQSPLSENDLKYSMWPGRVIVRGCRARRSASKQNSFIHWIVKISITTVKQLSPCRSILESYSQVGCKLNELMYFIPDIVAMLDESEHVFYASYVLFLQTNNLHDLLSVLQHAQLYLLVQQIKHL